jgi:hypothetical protein
VQLGDKPTSDKAYSDFRHRRIPFRESSSYCLQPCAEVCVKQCGYVGMAHSHRFSAMSAPPRLETHRSKNLAGARVGKSRRERYERHWTCRPRAFAGRPNGLSVASAGTVGPQRMDGFRSTFMRLPSRRRRNMSARQWTWRILPGLSLLRLISTLATSVCAKLAAVGFEWVRRKSLGKGLSRWMN